MKFNYSVLLTKAKGAATSCSNTPYPSTTTLIPGQGNEKAPMWPGGWKAHPPFTLLWWLLCPRMLGSEMESKLPTQTLTPGLQCHSGLAHCDGSWVTLRKSCLCLTECLCPNTSLSDTQHFPLDYTSPIFVL
ncbi:hypothetical protein KIL84_010284 [Mauremys mutica]|uniref:Uncharacterized protein n=1 Tax=Mauremys mutica TaxID=74926 RepID=A0A9D3XNU4_9SAUR|nr:hypothetical protein KIL84_010284 [Mauremys mutica]